MVKTIIMVLFYAMAMVKDTIGAQNEVDQWLQAFDKANEKVTRIHFYVQVFSTGPNKTDVAVAQGPESSKSPSSFGTVIIYDYHVTEGPEPTSNKLGRAQGIASFNDRDEIAFLLVFNFVFTSGEFNGSSIAMLGRNPVFHPLRDLPIVGGTGMFRLARGFAKTTTYQFNTTTNNGVYEYNVVVLHY